MNSIDIDGKKYVSSKVAAKATGYATDYIGQLARGGKIPATRVGRAWYVEKDALFVYAGLPIEENSEGEVTSTDEASPEEVLAPKEEVRETVKPLSVQVNQNRALHTLQKNPQQVSTLKTWSDIQYSQDSSSLIPDLQKNPTAAVPVKINKNTAKNIDKSRFIEKKATRDNLTVTKTYNLLPLTATVTVLIVVFVTATAVSGAHLGSDWSFAGIQTASVSSEGSDFTPFSVVLDVFFQATELLIALVSFLLDSFGSFFSIS